MRIGQGWGVRDDSFSSVQDGTDMRGRTKSAGLYNDVDARGATTVSFFFCFMMVVVWQGNSN